MSFNAMEQKRKDFLEIIKKAILTGYQIVGPILKVSLEPEPSFPSVLHFQFYDDNGICYFFPIMQNFKEDDSIEKIAFQYSLFDTARYGDQSLFIKALELGGDLNAFDYRVNSIPLVFLQHNGDLCTHKDLKEGRGLSLAPSPRPFCGINKHGWTVMDHAKSRARFTIMKEIHMRATSIDQKKLLFVDELCKKAELAEKKLLQAQQEQAIPTFFLEKTCDLFKDIEHNADHIDSIESLNDKNLKIKTLITKGKVTIGCETPITTWKQQALDLDTLAKVYATVICFNNKEGNSISHLFKHWNTIPLFRTNVINAINDNLNMQMYGKRTLIPENLVILTNQALKAKVEPIFLKEYLVTALQYFISEKKDPIFNQQYHALLDTMLDHPETKNILKDLCNQQPTLFNETVKPKLQEKLWRNYVAKMLHHSHLEKTEKTTLRNLSKDLIHLIVSFWQPDKAINSIDEEK